MMKAVRATYLSDKEIDALIKRFSGSGGKIFNNVEEVDEYIRQSREDRVF